MTCLILLILYDLMAEREGFEPPVPLRVRLISSQVHSTGLCHLSAWLSLAAAEFASALLLLSPPAARGNNPVGAGSNSTSPYYPFPGWLANRYSHPLCLRPESPTLCISDLSACLTRSGPPANGHPAPQRIRLTAQPRREAVQCFRQWVQRSRMRDSNHR